MVLTRRRRLAWLALIGGIPGPLHAQETPPAAPVLEIPEDLFTPTLLTFGGATVEIGGIAQAQYDSNIFAQQYGVRDDTILVLRPYVAIEKRGSTLELSARAQGNVRQYLKYDSESAVGGDVRTRIAWSPTAADKLTLLTGYLHGIEDRGEPEARTLTGLGPREFDTIDADLSYARRGQRFGILVRGSAATFRYADPIDRNRNLDTYGILGRASYRVGPLVNGFAEGFVNRRDYAPIVGEGVTSRDSNTYGARIGVGIDPGGTLRGDAAVGVYRFDPRDRRMEGRTGLSAQVGLIYQPLPRTAFTLDGFVGNVATYVSGARSREDMRVRLGYQQEVRHNLRLQAGIIYRRSRYFGTGIVQNIYGGSAELEYLLNRRLALSGAVNYASRDSTAPLDGYSRFRGTLSLKFHY